MAVVSRKTVGQYKSSLYDVSRNLLKSRDAQARRAKAIARELRGTRAESRRAQQEVRQLEQQLREKEWSIAELENKIKQFRQQPVYLPDDPPLPNHTYGPIMISLCINLAKAVGFRGAESALRIVFEAISVEARVPERTAIRTWVRRLGVATLESPVEEADDWIWMADHSNQIGPEKVLVLLGIRASKMPEPGQAIRHEDVRPLAVIPGTDWKREDVAEQYKALAQRIGKPMAVLTDGAIELRESIAALENKGERVIALRDFKHFAANVLKKTIGKDKRFEKFLRLAGRTRSEVQQTELAHFMPPAPKPKARFMNLAATLKWAEVILWQLSHPRSEGRQRITAQRMNQKLGWIRRFRDDIMRWSRCQAVVSASLTFINEHALYIGAAADLKAMLMGRVTDSPDCVASRRVIDAFIDFVSDSEQQLDEGIRVPMSTEILESSFALYKALERQHSKGGFTSLLAAFPALLCRATPARVRDAFARVKVERMKEWTQEHLGKTLGSKRHAAYREHALHPSG